MCMLCRGQQTVLDLPGLELQMVVSYSVGAGKENPHPLQEQPVLLTTELPLWVQNCSSQENNLRNAPDTLRDTEHCLLNAFLGIDSEPVEKPLWTGLL